MDVKIIVATHKEYKMPEDIMYLPVFVGSANTNVSLPYQRDDEGDNISEKNNFYCELSGLYWAYKNLDADYIGLCHYRRLFQYKDHIMSFDDMNKLISITKIILPKKRRYYIETVYNQFVHAHGKQSIDLAEKMIKEYYPTYIDAFNEVMNRRSLHLYNMFVMEKNIFHRYCRFLFDILGNVEKNMEVYDRLLGYLGERLLDVFITANKMEYVELKVMNTERINWPKKIFGFVMRKLKNTH